MTHFAHKVLLFLLLSTAAGGVFAQTTYYRLHNHDSLLVQNCHGDNIQIAFPQNYIHEFETYVVIETNGVPFEILANYYHEYGEHPAVLRIWDGDSTTGTLLVDTNQAPYHGFIHSASGRLAIHLQRTDSALASIAFTISWYNNPAAFTSTCINDVQNIHLSHLTHYDAVVKWEGQTSYYQVSYGNTTQVILGDSIHLTNLEPDSQYTVSILPLPDQSRPCCSRTLTFRTDCIPYSGCPDFTNLHNGSVRGYYGTFAYPYDSVGFVETPNIGRHLVFNDTTETDPHTGGQLRTVCPGTRASVRLGNSLSGSEAEAIEYFLAIDTNLYALLLLHYAVVLQNPNHSSSEQPRFRMEILDSENNVIDPICGTVDFIAGNGLGWNEYGVDYIWKDWTTLGFDMTPYHGKSVKVRFTTYDCSAGLHAGYAYFNAECRLNSATTEYCGETETNSITAPDGFDYLWYYNSPSSPVSTEQTVYFTNNDALLHCRLISRENPNCWVTLNTYAGHRWPLAIIDTLGTESLGCDGYRVYFLNRSVVTKDNGDTVDRHCETARWYFGDAFMSFEYSPQHVYRDSGDFNVTLVSGIANNSCTDTAHFTVHIPDFFIHAPKDTFACDTFWIDNIAYPHDTIGPQYRVHHPEGCDTMYTLNLIILHSPLFELPPDTFCYNSTYFWLGQTAGNPHITDTAHYRLFNVVGIAANGCDSLESIRLVQLPPDNISISREADCDTKRYILTASSPLPYLQWQSDPPDTCLIGHEHDSTVYVYPLSHTIYTVTTDHRDTLYCPTVATVSLQPVTFPEASFTVNPSILTYEHPEFNAFDDSHYSTRQWSLLFYPDGTDTIPLNETSAHLRYRLEDFSIDSVRVLLAVSNGACLDTTYRTLPLAKIAIWVPNTFTPSEDVNNRFAPVTTGLLDAELYIYDRTGRLIFNTQDMTQGWDGTQDGRLCPQGTYVWFLRYHAMDYPTILRTSSGSITLLR